MNDEGDKIILKLIDLWKVYSNGNRVIHALNKVNYSFPEGYFSIINGPSGSGKSTLIRVMGLIEKPTMGHVLIKGDNTVDYSQKKRNSLIRGEIGFVFQGRNLLPPLNALANVTIPMRSPANNLARKLLQRVGFKDYKKFPDEMSFEEQQRVTIARAMTNNHSIILADEPTGDLHTDEAKNIMELLLDLNQSEELTIIMVTNNDKLSEFSGKSVKIVDGRFTK